MIEIGSKKNKYTYNAYHIVKSFFPGEEIIQKVDEKQEPLVAVRLPGGSCFSLAPEEAEASLAGQQGSVPVFATQEAHEQARNAGTTGVYLNTLFRYAVTGAKKVKTDTQLSKTSVSTASLAVKAALWELGSLSGKKVMVIGASGKIGSIVLKNLATVEGTELFATTRRTNIRHHGAAFVQIPFSERYSYFDQMDVIISATASPHYTITKQRFSEHIRTKKPRVLVDLAVPMDLEKSIKDMDGVRYYNIDDLELIARENNEKKKKEAEAAGLILENYEDKFEQWRIFKHYQNTMDTVCNFMERESRNKGVEHAVRKLFYQVRDSAQPEGLELFFQSLEERNRQWED